MCEPHHSINQFDDDDGPRTGMLKGQVQQKPESWLKKISKWFHFSRMGAGHSEAITATGRMDFHTMPTLTRYEVKWWNRSIHRDGSYFGYEKAEAEHALEAATDYANRVSIGSLQNLRRFLEMSFLKTPYPQKYAGMFRCMLSQEGVSQYEKRLQRFGGVSRLVDRSWSEEKLRKAIAAVCCGLTRKRGLLIPEWADDKELWIPSSEIS